MLMMQNFITLYLLFVQKEHHTNHRKVKSQERISIHAFLNVAAVDDNEIVELFRKQNIILKDVKVLLQKQFKEK